MTPVPFPLPLASLGTDSLQGIGGGAWVRFRVGRAGFLAVARRGYIGYGCARRVGRRPRFCVLSRVVGGVALCAEPIREAASRQSTRAAGWPRRLSERSSGARQPAGT